MTTLNAAGSGLVYLHLPRRQRPGKWSQTGGPAVAIGPSGDAFVTGSTRSTNFPTRDAIQSTYGGGLSDAFVANFDAAGHLVSSTYVAAAVMTTAPGWPSIPGSRRDRGIDQVH